MNEINNAITTNITPAKEAFNNSFNTLANGLLNSIQNEISINNIENTVSTYLEQYEPSNILSSLEKEYIIPKDTFKITYNGVLKGLLQVYIMS